MEILTATIMFFFLFLFLREKKVKKIDKCISINREEATQVRMAERSMRREREMTEGDKEIVRTRVRVKEKRERWREKGRERR